MDNYHHTLIDMVSHLPQGEVVKLKVVGGSMRPFLQINDRVTIKHVPINQVVSGDILSYLRGSEIITHRLLIKKGQFLILKGDYTLSCDLPVQSSLVIGKVIEIERDHRAISTQTPIYRLLNKIMAITHIFVNKIAVFTSGRGEKL